MSIYFIEEKGGTILERQRKACGLIQTGAAVREATALRLRRQGTEYLKALPASPPHPLWHMGGVC
jgi:hypothetical protein